MRKLTLSFLRLVRYPLPLLILSFVVGCQHNIAATSGSELPSAVLGHAPDLVGEEVTYPVLERNHTGYIAQPQERSPTPGVILIHDGKSLTNAYREMADALSGEGYISLAINLDASDDPTAGLENVEGSINYILQETLSTGRVAIIGWGTGADLALDAALNGLPHQGTALFYPQLTKEIDYEGLWRIRHEIYASFVTDQSTDVQERVNRLNKVLLGSSIPTDMYVYRGVSKDFWFDNTQSESWEKEDAWIRLKAYLTRTLD